MAYLMGRLTLALPIDYLPNYAVPPLMLAPEMLRARQIALAETAVEKIEGDAIELEGEFGVVARAFIPHEGVGSVDLVPAVAETLLDAQLVEAREDPAAVVERDVRVLAAPDHEEVAPDVGGASERIVAFALAQRAPRDVSGVEADRAGDVGLHRGAEGEVAAQADAEGAEFAGAVRARGEVVERGAGVGVIAGKLFGVFELVAAVRAGLVVGEDSPGRLELVVDLGDGDDVAVTGEHGRHAADGAGDLEDLGPEDDAGILAGRNRAGDVSPHGSVGSGEIDEFFGDDHGRASTIARGTDARFSAR